MKHVLLGLMAISFFISCNEEKEIAPDLSFNSNPGVVLESLTISMNGEKGDLKMGAIPHSKTNLYPSLLSAPESFKSSSTSLERIDLVFEIDSEIEEVYFSIYGALQHYAFYNTDEPRGLGTQAVSLTMNMPASVSGDSFCALISVKDANQFISDVAEICIEMVDAPVKGRKIYFADFATNSRLATLDFNSGEVETIGYTGFSLSDIAFLGDKLYGVTLRSELIAIDLNSGEGKLIGKIGVSKINALEGRDNLLYGASGSGEFLSINPVTAKGSVIDVFDSSMYSSGDLVFDKNNEFLYGTLVVPNASFTNHLALINPTTGETTIVGDTEFRFVWGLALFRNQLLGLTGRGEFIIIDPYTGKGTLVENTEAFSAGGAAAIKK